MADVLPTVAIIGQPNVGKSSIFNRLVGSRHAVVARESGTTRDSVEQLLTDGHKTYHLVDTAGTGEKLAASVQPKQLYRALDQGLTKVKTEASIILLVIDAKTTINQSSRELARQLLKTGKPVILVVNKLDLNPTKLPAAAERFGIKTVVGVSAHHNLGFSELKQAINQLLPNAKIKPIKATKLALIGRPNVGKSSLFNALAGEQQAIVSSLPHTTRDVKTVTLKLGDTAISLFDTGGIRRPFKRTPLEQFSYMRSLWAIDQADVVALVLEPGEQTSQDQKLAGLVKDAGKGLILVINKWDTVEQPAEQRTIIENRMQQLFAFSAWAPLIFTSASLGTNVAKLPSLCQKVKQNRGQKLATSQLNQLLQTAVSHQPPAGLKNRQPKLKYITQTGTNPPAVTIFGSQTSYLHWSYKRYLENQLRFRFDLTGTPITLSFRSEGNQ